MVSFTQETRYEHIDRKEVSNEDISFELVHDHDLF